MISWHVRGSIRLTLKPVVWSESEEGGSIAATSSVICGAGAKGPAPVFGGMESSEMAGLWWVRSAAAGVEVIPAALPKGKLVA